MAGQVTHRPGEVITVPDPAVVTLPDGREIRVVGGRYVVESEGAHKARKG